MAMTDETRVRIPEMTALEHEAAEHVRRLRESHVHTERTERTERRRERQERERAREREPQDWSAWNTWCDQRIATALAAKEIEIYETVTKALDKLVSDLLDKLSKEKELKTQLQALKCELAEIKITILRSAPSAPISFHDRRATN
jgi:hypothetical protein